MPCFTMSLSSMTPRTSVPSATTSGVEPARAICRRRRRARAGRFPEVRRPAPHESAGALADLARRPSRGPDIRVVAENGMNSRFAPRSRSRMLNRSLARTTIERPSGVSSASEASWAASATSSSVWPPAGMNSDAMRLPSVIVPVLSRRSVWTSPAASTARPLIASTLRCTRRSIPAIPIAERSAPIVVGMRQTSSGRG